MANNLEKKLAKNDYTDGFYAQYSDYLREKGVRSVHNRIFKQFSRFTSPTLLEVMDLGCGLGEYSRYGSYKDYVGIDLNDTGSVKKFIGADYKNLSFMKRLPFAPNAFVSLFSIEPTMSADKRYKLYENIFRKIPSIEYALVSGFFYGSRRGMEKLGEAGGINSYQTIEDPHDHISNVFSEYRILVRNPSKMFGDDVVEVWKILVRKKAQKAKKRQ